MVPIFLNVFCWEFVGNIILIGGVVVANHVSGWRKYGLAVLAGVVGAVVIVCCENFKIRNTTLPFSPVRLGDIAWGGIFFVGLEVFGAWYFGQARRGWQDALTGGILGAVLSIAELLSASSSIEPLRWVSHTVAFLVTGPVMVFLARWLLGLPSRWVWWATLGATLLMSLIITIVDYGPFLA